MECSFCNNNFSSISVLNRHLRTNKKCLKIQNNLTDNIVDKRLFECEFCNKELSSKQTLKYHIDICKKKHDTMIVVRKQEDDEKYNNLQQQVLELKKELEETKKRPTNMNNITINTNIDNSTHHNYGNIMTYMTKELVQETFEKNYTLQDFFGSQKALAEFTTRNFLMGKNKALYLCTDKSRKRFIYTDDEQNEIEDLNAAILIKLISKGFGTVEKLYKKESTILKSRLSRFEKDDYTEMVIETREQIKKLEEVYKQIINIIKEGDGYRNQLSRSLPTSLEHRIDIDNKLEQLEDSVPEDESEDESEHENNNETHNETQIIANPIKEPILYDTTARHIGGITYGKLRLYKNHYQKCGEVLIPKSFIDNDDYKKKFLEFMYSDE